MLTISFSINVPDILFLFTNTSFGHFTVTFVVTLPQAVTTFSIRCAIITAIYNGNNVNVTGISSNGIHIVKNKYPKDT